MEFDLNSMISNLLGAPGLIGQQSQQNMNGLAQREALQQETAQRAQLFQQQAQQQQSYDADVSDWTAKGAPATGLLNLIARHPDKYQALKAGWDIKDDAQKTSDLGYFGSVHAALDNNKPDLATKLIEDRITAEKQAGLDTTGDEQLLEGIKAGDPDALNSVKGFALANIAAATGPGRFAETYAKLGGSGATVEGKVVGNAIGHYEGNKFIVDYKSDKPEYKTVDVFDANGNKIGERVITLGGEGGDLSSGGAGASDGSGAPPSGRYTGGWTPRARNGGDNTDAAVDNKIAGMAAHLGVDPDAPLTGMSPMQIAQALTLSEGGPGSLADKNNNPGNLRDPKTLAYRKFPTKEAGLKAAAAQVARNLSRGQNTIRSMVEGRPVGGKAPVQTSGSGVAYESVATGPTGARKMTPQEVAAEGLNPNVVYYRGKDGVPQAVEGQTKPPASLTEAQGKATGYLGTAVAAQRALNSITGGTYQPSEISLALNDMSNKNPIKRNLSQTDRRVLNAQLAFATALLRLESGAVVGKDEAAAKAQVLFPQPGDGPQVQADKRAQREAGLAALRAAAGPGGNNIPRILGSPVKVRSVGEAMKLPKGTVFITPDGRRKVR